MPLGFSREVQQARRAFQRTVRRAKRQFWHTIINEVKDSTGIYKLARWAKRSSPFQPPPLFVGEEVFEAQLQRAEALLKAILERRGEEDDIEDAWAPIAPNVTSLSIWKSR